MSEPAEPQSPPAPSGALARFRALLSHSPLRAIALVIGVLGVAALVAVALNRLGLGRVGSSLSSLRPGWLILALALMALSLVLRGLSWIAALRAALPDHRVPRLTVIRATMIGVMGSALVPGRVGELARAVVVARRTGSTRSTLAVVVGTIFSQTLINLVALAGLAAVTVSSVPIFHGKTGAVLAAVIVPGIVLMVVLASPRLLVRARRSRYARIRRGAEWLSRQTVSVAQGLTLFARPRYGISATVAQLGAWALQWMSCYAVLLSLSLQGHSGLRAAAAVLLAVNVSAVVPATPSNVGVFQAACLVVLAAFGVDAGPALAYGVLLQGVEVVTAIGLGVPALLGEGLRWADLRRTHHLAGAEEIADPATGSAPASESG